MATADDMELAAATALLDQLAKAVPAVRPLMDTYFATHGQQRPPSGEPLPFEFIRTALAPWVVDDFLRSGEEDRPDSVWKTILDFLEAKASSLDKEPRSQLSNMDMYTKFAIDHFKHALPTYEAPGAAIRDHLGPVMGWKPPRDPEFDAACQAFVDRMLQAVPAIRPAYERHLAYHRELLGYGFLAEELKEWLIGDYLAARARGETTGAWRDIIDFLDRERAEFHAHREHDDIAFDLEDMIDLAFLENLPEEHQPGHDIVEYLTPQLQEALLDMIRYGYGG